MGSISVCVCIYGEVQQEKVKGLRGGTLIAVMQDFGHGSQKTQPAWRQNRYRLFDSMHSSSLSKADAYITHNATLFVMLAVAPVTPNC